MDYERKLILQSNYWYNDGLKKASIRDLSGAATSLRRSLQYNRENISARNLLGLVYYGRGEIAEALVEWVISKNFQSTDNLAGYYIDRLKKKAGELEGMNQTVKKFNQCLEYCRKNSEDLALIQLKKVVAAQPSFLKAWQLMGLIYLKTEKYHKARTVLTKARKIDATNEMTLHYLYELSCLRQEKKKKDGMPKKSQGHTVTYQLGNETIIRPISDLEKGDSKLHSLLNLGLGVAVGAAVVWFLIAPQANKARIARINDELASYSEQLATKETQISALKTELAEYRVTGEKTQEAVAGAQSTAASYEALMTVQSQYNSNEYSNATMVDGLLTVNREVLGEQGKEIYDTLAGDLFEKEADKRYASAIEQYQAGEYDKAVELLNQVLTMVSDYGEGKAMLLLGNCLVKKGETEQAQGYYQSVVESHGETEAGSAANQGLAGTITEIDW